MNSRPGDGFRPTMTGNKFEDDAMMVRSVRGCGFKPRERQAIATISAFDAPARTVSPTRLPVSACATGET